jgi:predicted membrane protein
MRISRRERGEGNFGCLVGLILLVIAGFIAYKMIPVKVKNAELRATISDEAKSAGTHNDDKIRDYILAKAREDELPVTAEDVNIVRANSEITIEVNYTIPIQFPGYTYQWHIEHHVHNPIF